MEDISDKQNNPKRILIVEDDEGLNALLQLTIKRAGYNTEGVLTGKEVMEKIREQNYDLLLLDYVLSDMSAAQLIETLKANGISIPFIVMTGQGDENIAVQMMKLGARDYLIKDGNYLEQLPHTVERLIYELEIENKFRQAQDQLKESEEKLKFEHEQLLSIYESISEPISVTDLETYEILFSNSAFRDHFGEVKNIPCFKHIYQNDEPCLFCPIPFLKQEHNEAYYWEYQNQINKRWYRYVDKIIQWPNGEKVHFQLAFDISSIKLTEQELIKAKEKAEEADRLKTAFLANMSHEIRTPMNAIIGFTEILLEQEIDRERQKEFLKIVQNRSNDLLQIINDILDISSIEAGSMEIIESTGDLNDMFQEIYQFYVMKEYMAENKRPIDFQKKVFLTPKQSLITADFMRVKQIITNLLDNSFKFTNSGSIEFGCKLADKKELLMYVKDTGIGILPDKYPIVFSHFTQAEESFLTRKAGGIGLGLSISKGLVDIMKGKIWFESLEEKGSTFYFTLPYKPVNKLEEIAPKKSEMLYHWDDKTILVVEDDPFNTALISELLNSTGLRCLYAKNGSEAMELFFKESAIELVLMDIRLPDASGLKLMQLMKSSNPGIIIIAQTAYAYDNDKETCINSGCDDYITKPLIKANLLQLIDKYFSVAVESKKG